MSDAPRPALTIVIVGASGDLARKKLVPALFALYCQGFLPERFCIIGYARHPMTDDEFRKRIETHLTCRYVPDDHDGDRCAERMREFLGRCHYVAGQYDSVDGFLELFQRMRGMECGANSNRVYYMAIPPFLFLDVARAMGNAGLVACGRGGPWSRVVIEKPFGRDRASSDELVTNVGKVFTENQTYRIDHYLGKEIIQNLLVLRFANRVFEPLWNSDFIESVRIFWKEDIGVGDRGGYFDEYGIVRDVVQNHLAQILALIAMEPPATLRSGDVSAAKAEVLRAVIPARAEDWVAGQYEGYLAEPGIPSGSTTVTFAAGPLRIDNDRWRDTPFFMYAGKGLDARMTEIRIRFRPTHCRAVGQMPGPLAPNELVIRVQPDEHIRLGIINKVPGLEMKLERIWLDLTYESAFKTLIPDAYEYLLLDVIEGDSSLFISQGELAAAWDVFTPMLHEWEHRNAPPQTYVFGSQGPEPLPCATEEP